MVVSFVNLWQECRVLIFLNTIQQDFCDVALLLMKRGFIIKTPESKGKSKQCGRNVPKKAKAFSTEKRHGQRI